MAGFFDDKEEVMTIELTEWGKYLYSIGKFKPKYYAFSDDEVLYDGTYGGLSSEEQKDIEDRIMNNTPYLKPHTRLVEAKGYYQEYDSASEPNSQVYSDPIDSMTLVDTKIENKIELLMQKNSRYSQATRELRYLVRSKIGTTRSTSTDYPAFDLTMLRSKIESATNSMSSSYGYLKIPQLEVNLQNILTIVPSGSVFVSRLDEKANLGNINPNLRTLKESVTFQDGSKIYFENNFLALDLFQEGVEYKTKNFTVEVFEYTVDDNGYSLKELKQVIKTDEVDSEGFLQPRNTTDSLPFANQISTSLEVQTASSGDMLSDYFDLQIDRDIPDEVICALSKEAINRGDNLRLDYDIECLNSNLSLDEATLTRNIATPGIEISELDCSEQGGPGCR